MKNRKIIMLLIIVVNMLLSIGMPKAQQISPNLFGQNAWMPDSIGSVKFYGSLDSHWPVIAESGVKMMRYGGIGVDANFPTKHQYIKMIDAMRARGIEPMVAVPFNKWQYTAAQAADIVRYVNITMGRNVRYWIIGNEPDLGYAYTTSTQVASYIKPFASAMKSADPSIKIIGPECAWYNAGIINGLTTPGGPDDITGTDANGRFYVDIVSFHAYPMQAGSYSRSAVITNLTALYNFQDNLTALNARLASCNTAHGRSGATALQVGVTEVNINYQNPAGDNLYGNGAKSFLGGQYWAEVMGISMKKGVSFLNFWSVIEGNSDDMSIGYLARGTAAKVPSYFHFQMVAQNFKGLYADGTDNQANVKTFGSKDGTQVAVMIMNQDAAANFNYTVRLDNNAVSGANPLKINISAGIGSEYSGTIDNQSTQVLIFNLSGALVKKIDYKLNGNASAGLPPTVTQVSAPVATTLTATVTAASSTAIATGGSVVLNANTGTGFIYQWVKNGVNITGATASSYTATAAGSYQVKITQGTANAWSAPVAVTVSTLTATITAASATSFATGGSVVLKANTGTGYIYQWIKNGANITGATASTYTATTAGSYQVKVTQGTANAWSAPVAVTVSTLTATITAASATTFATGGSVVLKGNTGTGYTYQWIKNGVNITGATASNYTATTAGSYQLRVTLGTQNAWSAPVTVTVTTLSAVITPASATTFATGGSVVLKANTGTGYIYQWIKNGVNITGATASTYTATTAGSYQLRVTLGTQNVWSAPVAVTVTTLAAVITPATATTFPTGGSVVLKANTGTGYIYQWIKNGVNITGATASTYTATTAGSYQLKITLGTQNVWSAPVTVTVTTATLTATITVGGSTNIPTGGSVMLYANTGSGYIYQWKKNGIAIYGATASSYKVTSAGSYQLKIAVGTQNAWSSPVSITQGATVRLNGDSTTAANEPVEANNEIKGRPGKNEEGNGKNAVIGKSRPGSNNNSNGNVNQVGKPRSGADNNTNAIGQARSGASDTTASEAQNGSDAAARSIGENVFNVKIGPNPSNDVFGFTVNTSGEEPITVRVFDMNGRLCVEEKNLTPNETVKLGEQLASGHYIAQVEQGQKKQVVKIVKAN
jgi:hypothetical protein